MTVQAPSRTAVLGGVLAVAVATFAAVAVRLTTADWPLAVASAVCLSSLTFLLFVVMKSSRRAVPRASAGPRRAGPLGLALLALCALLISGRLAFGPHGDVSIMNECQGNALTAYLDPQPEIEPTADSISNVNFGRFCNEDAVHKMHLVLGLLPLSLLAAIVSGMVIARRKPAQGSARHEA